MAEGEKPCKLEPQDRSSRVPNVLAFIIYRFVPIGSLSVMVYGMYQKYGFLDGLMFLILANPILLGLGIGLGCSRRTLTFEYTAEEAPSRTAWADMLREQIQDFVANRRSFPFGFRTLRLSESTTRGVQRHKGRIATYLSGSRQGIPPIISLREGLYLRTIFYTMALGGLRLFCGDFPQPPRFSAILDCFTRQNIPLIIAYCCGFMLWTLFSIQVGRCWGWHDDLSCAGKAIRKACMSVDTEKGGDTRKELEWWIEAILTEESDSPALAKERREVIIVPILDMIRC